MPLAGFGALLGGGGAGGAGGGLPLNSSSGAQSDSQVKLGGISFGPNRSGIDNKTILIVGVTAVAVVGLIFVVRST